ncbi:MAG: radical SAM protein [Bernardetiaceae bacterium]
MRLIPHPVLCNYYLTYRCNARCSFCDIWERPSPFVRPEDVLQNLHDLRRLGVKVIDFTGGEPLLHPQIPDFLREAKNLGFITTLTTNAMRYLRMAHSLQGQVDMLHFSLDAADAHTHDTLRGVPCFDSVMESIAVARSLGERPDILFTVSDQNMDELPRVWEEICLPNDLILIINPIFDYNQIDNGGGLSVQNLDHLRSWAWRKRVYLNTAFLDLRQRGGNRRSDPVCKAGSSTVVISPQNALVLPCYHAGLEEIPIEGKLYDLHRSAKVQRLIAQEGRMPACEGCAINCYMQPSFAVEMNRYWWLALPSTLRYNFMKGTWRKLKI